MADVPNWSDLQGVYEKAKFKAGITFSVEWSEVNDTWGFATSSAAKSENITVTDYSWDTMIRVAHEILDCIIAGPNGRKAGHHCAWCR